MQQGAFRQMAKKIKPHSFLAQATSRITTVALQLSLTMLKVSTSKSIRLQINLAL